MSNEYKTIHDFDLNLICEYFSNVERQGPGSPEVTIKALSFIDNLPEHSSIADIGCGTGGQTMTLAQHIPGLITGLDLFPDFIRIFNRNAEQLNLHKRVKGVVGSMTDALPFEQESLDLIWSEGAIYNIGFERGLNEWKQYLKKDGYIAVSEASWFTEERPAEIHKFWMDAYTEIDTIPNKVAQMQRAGYVPVATFVLPSTCWTEHFFTPCEKAQEMFLKKHPGNPTVEDLIMNQRHEKELYDKYKEFYGYVFYIGRKI
ncbi:class I SAM-dependent methyltransferase [Porphyromonadaceae bacterium OttesenSCG-928-L07]|nr:class I SAM-dependent methyltransferase [Porphyromonadaceae bacterium OttesenSCG-928-L07]MDL2330972.1 class I SAM-dependent methyltransferase [Odoribacter sp. OttesenSCG-928-A06]